MKRRAVLKQCTQEKHNGDCCRELHEVGKMARSLSAAQVSTLC